jgi:hypothetical protein
VGDRIAAMDCGEGILAVWGPTGTSVYVMVVIVVGSAVRCAADVLVQRPIACS